MRIRTTELVIIIAALVVALQAAADAGGGTPLNRLVHAVTECDATLDGSNVSVWRCLGGYDTPSQQRPTFDPLIIWDVYRPTGRKSDFMGGFPAHPHQGFLEVRYILRGCLEHQDSCGNRAIVTPGSLSVLFAGRGVVHEERTTNFTSSVSSEVAAICNREGSFEGFQIWINVRSTWKKSKPWYQLWNSSSIPTADVGQGSAVTVLSGDAFGVKGPLQPDAARGLLMLDVTLRAASGWRELPVIPTSQHVVLYMLDGTVQVGDEDEEPVEREQLVVLGRGHTVRLRSVRPHSRLLLVSAPRTREAVVMSGGFVQSTKEELRVAVEDLRRGGWADRC